MPPEPDDSLRRPETRRQFIKEAGMLTATVVATDFFQYPLSVAPANRGVSIVLDPANALTRQVPVQWAAGQLRDALLARDFKTALVTSLEQAPPENLCVFVTGMDSPMVRQALDKHGLAPAHRPAA